MTGISLGLSFLLGVGLGPPGALAGAAFACAAWIGGKTRPATATLVVLAAMLGGWRSPDHSAQVAALESGPNRTLSGIVVDQPSATRTGQRFVLVVDDELTDRQVRYCTISTNAATVPQGATVRATGSATGLRDVSAQTQAVLRARSCDASFETTSITVLDEPSLAQRILNSIRDRLASVYQRSAPGDSGALMTGLVTGDDGALSAESRQAFLSTGTTHITAVSGANFAVLIVAAAAVAGAPGNRRRLHWIAATAAIIWLYALLVGLPPPATRAAMMASLAMIAVRIGRRPDFLTLLIVSAAIQLAIRPHDLYSLSFQLSFVATLALVLVFSGTLYQKRHIAWAVVVTAIAAHLATVPILAHRIGEIALATVPTNIAISPLVVIAYPMAALAGVAGLVSERAGVALAIPGSVPSGAILWIIERASLVLPGTVTVGSMTTASTLLLGAVCWGTVLVTSHDVRIAGARGIEWISKEPERLKLAWSISAAVIALAAVLVIVAR